jgi:hypothetical protein
MRNANNIAVGKPEGERPHGRLRCRWGDNVRMDIREIGWEDVNWLHLVQYTDEFWAVVYTVMNLQIP